MATQFWDGKDKLNSASAPKASSVVYNDTTVEAELNKINDNLGKDWENIYNGNLSSGSITLDKKLTDYREIEIYYGLTNNEHLTMRLSKLLVESIISTNDILGLMGFSDRYTTIKITNANTITVHSQSSSNPYSLYRINGIK